MGESKCLLGTRFPPLLYAGPGLGRQFGFSSIQNLLIYGLSRKFTVMAPRLKMNCLGNRSREQVSMKSPEIHHKSTSSRVEVSIFIMRRLLVVELLLCQDTFLEILDILKLWLFSRWCWPPLHLSNCEGMGIAICPSYPSILTASHRSKK